MIFRFMRLEDSIITFSNRAGFRFRNWSSNYVILVLLWIIIKVLRGGADNAIALVAILL